MHPTSTSPTHTTATAEAFDHRLVVRYTILLTIAGLVLLSIAAIADLPNEPFLLIITYVVLLGGSVYTARRTGPGGVRLLFRGLLRWRMGWLNAAIVLGAVPLTTIGLAAVTGTYVAPQDGWLPVLGSYLFFVFVYGLLLLNLWEETGWQGMVQRSLMSRYGLVVGSMITAIPFAIMHIPLQLRGVGSLREGLINVGVLFAMAPATRYLVGRTDYATGGSLLAVGLLHASWNASGQLSVVDGEVQYVGALVLVAIAALVVDVARSRSRTGVLHDHRSQRMTSPAAAG